MSGPRFRVISVRDWGPLLVVLAVFGSVSLWNLDAFEMLIWDEAEYASLGRSIAAGEGYRISDSLNFIRPPLWPARVAAMFAVTGSQTDAAAKVATLLYALVAITIVYWLVRLECGIGPAVVAACCLAIGPEFATGAVMLLSEIPFMALHTAALASFYLAFRRGEAWFYAGWACFALSLSVRYTALLFGPILAAVLVYEWMRDRANVEKLLRSRAFWLAPLLAVLILAPWYVRQWLVSGDALIGVKYASTQIPTYSSMGFPWYYYLLTVLPAMTLPIAVTAMAGLIHGALIARRGLAVYALLGTVVIFGWHMTYDYKEFRLVSASLPLLAIAAGVAARSWMDWRPKGSALRWAAPTVLLCIGLVMSAAVLRGRFNARLAIGEPSFLDAMEYLRASVPEDAVLAAENQAQVHWYSRRRTLGTPDDEAVFRQSLAEVDWVVVTSFERGQPDYLFALSSEVDMADILRGDVKSFRDSRYWTLLMRGDWVRSRVESEPEPAAGDR